MCGYKPFLEHGTQYSRYLEVPSDRYSTYVPNYQLNKNQPKNMCPKITKNLPKLQKSQISFRQRLPFSKILLDRRPPWIFFRIFENPGKGQFLERDRGRHTCNMNTESIKRERHGTRQSSRIAMIEMSRACIPERSPPVCARTLSPPTDTTLPSS